MKLWLGIKAACLITVSVFACILLADLHKLAGKATLSVENLDRTIIIIGGAATNVEKASRAWEKSSQEQSSETTKAMSRVSAAAGQLSSFISRTDGSINSAMLPALTDAIRSQSAALLTNQNRLGDDLSQFSQATTQLQGTLADAQVILTDPSIHQSLDNLATATQNASVATSEASASMAVVHKGLDYEYKQITAPVSKVKTVALFVARFVGRFFGF